MFSFSSPFLINAVLLSPALIWLNLCPDFGTHNFSLWIFMVVTCLSSSILSALISGHSFSLPSVIPSPTFFVMQIRFGIPMSRVLGIISPAWLTHLNTWSTAGAAVVKSRGPNSLEKVGHVVEGPRVDLQIYIKALLPVLFAFWDMSISCHTFPGTVDSISSSCEPK